MKQQQKKIRDELQLELAKVEKGIAELNIAIETNTQQKHFLSSQRQTMEKKAQQIRDTLEENYIEFAITDHALVQYLKRIKPELYKQICEDIKADKTIRKKVTKNVVTTIYKKGKLH